MTEMLGSNPSRNIFFLIFDFWGSTLNVNDESTLTATEVGGQNTLGQLLMMVRDRLKN